MKTSPTMLALLLLAPLPAYAQPNAQGSAQQAQQAAATGRAAQLAIEASSPKLAVTEEILPLRIPGHTLGETEGVSRNKDGHLFVYSRTGWGGSSRGGNAAKLFEFGPDLKFVKDTGNKAAHGKAVSHTEAATSLRDSST